MKRKRKMLQSLPLQIVKTHEKIVVYKQGRESSAGAKLANTMIFNFVASKTVRNKCLLLKTPVYDILLWQLELRQGQREKRICRVIKYM